MKSTFIVSCLLFQLSVLAQEAKPVLLPTPQDWRFERLDFPPSFAPELNYDAFEELRFAPGMFDPNSDTHFTYLLAIQFNEAFDTSEKNLNAFFVKYYQGLCGAVGKDQSLKLDEIESNLKRIKKNKWQGDALIFDSFNGGTKLEIYLDLEWLPQSKSEGLLFAIVSSQPFDAKGWKSFYAIKDDLELN